MTTSAACRVLVVDDDESLQYTFRELLSRNGYTVETTGDPFHALKLLPEFDPHIVILDVSMPKMNGLELLRKLKEIRPDVLALMITAFGSQEIAVKAIKSGADDYFQKPFSNELMLLTLENARKRLDLQIEIQSLREDSRNHKGIPFIGGSQAMKGVRSIIDQVAQADVTVLITGESGTGKEVVASHIFSQSPRRKNPFIKINCAALPESLIESELFGYEPGAFTGATTTRKGKFELADSGTIFLDEIGDMTPATQTKVLRVLQEREVERLGAACPIDVDVRMIAATNQNLEERISEGLFRSDLFYRLNVVGITIPPLRERREDIAPLARHFAIQKSLKYGRPGFEIPDDVMEHLVAHEWPGNVRELENGIARAVVLDDPRSIIPAMARGGQEFADPFPGFGPLEELPYKEAKKRILERFERYYLLALMDRVGHNVSRAARLAQMDRKNFWVKVKNYLPDRETHGEVGSDPEEP